MTPTAKDRETATALFALCRDEHARPSEVVEAIATALATARTERPADGEVAGIVRAHGVTDPHGNAHRFIEVAFPVGVDHGAACGDPVTVRVVRGGGR